MKFIHKVFRYFVRLFGYDVVRAKDAERRLVSYSQSGEDLIVLFLFSDRRKPMSSYLELGAHDGISCSNTYFFNKNYGVKGVLVEADPNVFLELKKNRPNDVVLNASVGDKDNVQNDYYVGAGTCLRSEAVRRNNSGVKTKEVVKIFGMSINNIIEQEFVNMGGWASRFFVN
jgi:hypothetical protein